MERKHACRINTKIKKTQLIWVTYHCSFPTTAHVKNDAGSNITFNLAVFSYFRYVDPGIKVMITEVRCKETKTVERTGDVLENSFFDRRSKTIKIVNYTPTYGVRLSIDISITPLYR